MQSTLRWLILALIAMFRFTETAIPHSLEDQIRRDAPVKWQEYISWASHIEGECSFRGRDNLLNKNETQISVFYINDPCSLVIGEKDSLNDIPRWVTGGNDKYDFSLQRNAANNWVVSSLKPKRNALQNTEKPRSKALGPNSPLGTAIGASCRGLLISTIWFNEMSKEQGFRIKKAAKEVGSHDGLVRIEFEYNPEVPRNVPIRSGVVVLDPSRYWLINNAEVSTTFVGGKYRGTISVKNLYSDAPFGIPVLTSQTTHSKIFTKDGKEDYDYEESREYRFRALTKIDTDEYKISAFGLPEFKHITDSHWPGIFIGINIAFIAILLTIYLTRFRHRASIAN